MDLKSPPEPKNHNGKDMERSMNPEIRTATTRPFPGFPQESCLPEKEENGVERGGVDRQKKKI